MKRYVAAFLAMMMLLLCGCTGTFFEQGTLNWDVNDIDHVKIENGTTGKTFSVADREIVDKFVSHINSFQLETETEYVSGYRYCVTLVNHLNGGAEYHFYIVNDETVRCDDKTYAVNAKAFRQYVETMECDTMTDNELIDTLLEGDTLERLNVVDEEGNISFDKILALPQTCPALFELMGRSSAIESISTYGSNKISAWLNSANPELVEKAQEWIEVLQKLMPDIQEKLENLIKN